MVLITEELSEVSKIQENGVSGGIRLGEIPFRTDKGAMDIPSMPITTIDEIGEESDVSVEECNEDPEADFTRNYWEDEDEIYQEFEELDFDSLPDHSDTHSVASDDSFYPPDSPFQTDRPPSPDSPEPISFYKACCNNNSIIVKIMIRQGVTEEEVKETDHNKRSGLIVACYLGYMEIVIALSQCPYLDINWQDNEGNTALITAAQAGYWYIANYLLNYFPGMDMERRNCHGFTALMKAAMQGRAECVRTLMLSGGDIQARDNGRQLTPREWALFTGRYETAYLMQRLIARPCAEQFCDSFSLEWPMLEERAAQSEEPKSCKKRLMVLFSCCPYRFYINNKVDPVDDGVFEHMVQVTTSICSPVMATACHTVCPGSPPCLGKRRQAVQEILRKQRVSELKRMGPERLNNYKTFFQNSKVLLIPKVLDRRASLQPLLNDVATLAMRRASLLPLHLLRRNSVRPGMVVPKLRLCKSPSSSYLPEILKRRSNHNQLQIPKWNYKMKRIERRQEEERQKLLPQIRRR
ncbi:ankyrin repeat domain-containing protein 33B-like isoform X1 [Gymnodraco acuticeps]|uniref:Ankyrin repeat domain-containing protein 33B-like isoform X1 n=1 Tax=Gymnodraco acuticeps TaxID=8218 RepID=A0A6P8VFK4_GYMAC|nr:ankyrin repeat domain-containing protein 33B-like isoform X1 [Gymnodraco acuticeps]